MLYGKNIHAYVNLLSENIWVVGYLRQYWRVSVKKSVGQKGGQNRERE